MYSIFGKEKNFRPRRGEDAKFDLGYMTKF